MAQIKDFDAVDFLRIESLVTNSGYRGDRISWNKICAYIKEARATVRAKRPVQHVKHKITCCGGAICKPVESDREWVACSQCGALYRK